MDPGTAMPELDSIYAYNLLSAEQGLRARLGYREWCTGLTGGDLTVRTTMSFHGSISTKDRLFQCTPTGIWDVSSSSGAPSQVLVFGDSFGNAGYGIGCGYITAAGHFYLYCDEVNGYHVYTESTGTWAKVALGTGGSQVSGYDPATFVSVTVWGSRAWFTIKNTGQACYLDAGSIYGIATAFNFGPRFPHGGYLVGLFSWSTDGGSGMTTKLVGISAGGDVVIYAGSDPASPDTFGIVGVWFVGGVPAGRRIATDFGGDLLIISRLGLVPLSKLVIGNPSVDRTVYATAKIANIFNLLMQTYGSLMGWAVVVHPTDNALMVLVPVAAGQPTVQLVMSYATRSWSYYRNLPILSADVWEGDLYFGTADGRTCVNRGYVDNLLLADNTSYSAVAWSLLTAYRGSGSMKQVQSVRPIFVADEKPPPFQVTVKYDFDQDEPAVLSAAQAAQAGGWDVDTWDDGVWSGGFSASATTVVGASGMGRDVALAIRGNSSGRTVFVGADIYYNEGGVL